MSAGQFQVKLSGHWEDYSEQEDKILKRAFMAGFPHAKFELRGQQYIYNFRKMQQINKGTGKSRDIRPPVKWKAPSKPIVPAGPTMTIVVPTDGPGKPIQVRHPKDKDRVFVVNVPPGAKVGQVMLVPIPDIADCPAAEVTVDSSKAEVTGAPLGGAGAKVSKSGWSTGAKVAAGVGGAAVVAGGAVLAAEVAEHGAEATLDAIGEGAGEAGAAIAEFAGEAGDFVLEGADEVGDFIMDLF